MPYHTGTITSAEPAKTLMDTMGGFIGGHAAWEFIEEVVGTGTNIARVYRCRGTVNGFNDFFIALVRTSLTSRVAMTVGETYNSTAKTFGNGAINSATTAIAVAADLGYATARHVANENTLAANTQGFLLAPGPTTGVYGVATNTGGFTYYLSITNHRVLFSTLVSGATSTALYGGLFDSFHAAPTVEAFPLCVVSLAGGIGSVQAGASLGGATTRATGSPSGSQLYPWPTKNYNWSAMLPINRPAGISKERISGRFFVSRILLETTLNSSSRPGAMIGLLKDEVGMANLEEVVEAVGDTLTISGNTWVCIEPAAAGSIWLNTTV